MRIASAVVALALLVTAHPATAAPRASDPEYLVARNEYTGKVDYAALLVWHGRKFCYQEWATIPGRRAVRQEAVVARPVPGKSYYRARSFFPHISITYKIWLRPTVDGYRKASETEHGQRGPFVPFDEVYIDQFRKASDANPTRFPCPKM